MSQPCTKCGEEFRKWTVESISWTIHWTRCDRCNEQTKITERYINKDGKRVKHET